MVSPVKPPSAFRRWRRRRRLSWGPAHFLGAALALAHGLAQTERSAEPINLARFGRLVLLDSQRPGEPIPAPHLGAATNTIAVALTPSSALVVEWDHPRRIRAVTLRCDGELPDPDEVRVRWWHRVWPDQGDGGWMKLDDPFNGSWVTVQGTAATNQAGWTLIFAPLDRAELPGVKHPGALERQTYRLEITCRRPLRVTEVTTRSDAVSRYARLRFEWNLKTTVPGEWNPQFEVRNGQLLRSTRTGPTSAIVETEYADAPDRLSPDRGSVVFRSGSPRSFAVFVDDVLREGGLYARDLGVFISPADLNLTYAHWRGPSTQPWEGGTVSERVARLPEQTLDAASHAFPAKPPPYLFLGVPNLRQEVALLPRGEIQMRADSLRSDGPDVRLRPWAWAELTYDFGSGEHPVMGPGRAPLPRSLADGWLPIVRQEWQQGDIRYTQTCLAAPLVTNIAQLQSRTGTETVVLAARFELENTGTQSQPGWLWMEINPARPLRLTVGDVLVLPYPSDGQARPGLVPVRARVAATRGTVDLGVLVPGAPGSYIPACAQTTTVREAVRYRVDLGPAERAAVDVFIPAVELLDAGEMAALRQLSFTQLQTAVTDYWQQRLAQGMSYDVPEPLLNDLFRANLWHVLISTDIDPQTGFHQHGAATHQYGNFLNETAMVARSLEMRGEHDAAFRLLEPFLACQGIRGLPGNFRSRQGVFYAAHPSEPDPYTAQGYNMHHGWGLWALAEHYLWTRDLSYLTRVAAPLVAGADWITRERQATRGLRPDGTRPVEFGLAPAGDLEDVEEYLYYYATDAYYHLGLRTAARALGEGARAIRAASGTTNPTGQELARAADRLRTDADAFRDDLRASLAESVATSPLVQLRDGTYVPYVPPRVYALTHRKEGWIREALYPALHLVTGEVLDARHPFVDWLVQDLEDNIFMSSESGYGLANPERDYFNLGGFTLQPNLLDLPLVYLQRDQVPNFLRAFHNTAAVSLYPDERCFAEWVPRFGQGGGPLYKTPDECRFVQLMRQMLILEQGNTLALGLGVPRAWMKDGQRIRVSRAATQFGKLDLEIRSQATSGRILATIRSQHRVAPEAVLLRLRHPDGRPLTSAWVNGKPARIDPARQLIELPVEPATWEVVGSF